MFQGDIVKIKPGVWRNYENIREETRLEVVEVLSGSHSHLFKLKIISHPRTSWATGYVNTYKKENFELVESKNLADVNPADLRVIMQNGRNFTTMVPEDKLESTLDSLLKKNTGAKYTVFKPDFEAFLPALPVERRAIV